MTGDRWKNSLREWPGERALVALGSHRGAMLESQAMLAGVAGCARWSRDQRSLEAVSEKPPYQEADASARRPYLGRVVGRRVRESACVGWVGVMIGDGQGLSQSTREAAQGASRDLFQA